MNASVESSADDKPSNGSVEANVEPASTASPTAAPVAVGDDSVPGSPAAAAQKNSSVTGTPSKRAPPPSSIQIPSSASAGITFDKTRPTQPQGHRKGAASVSQIPTRLSLEIPETEAVSSTPDLDFLIVLASQERRVLELREGLYKAEQHLLSLKKQWAIQEAAKTRSSARPLQSMRAMSAGHTQRPHLSDDEDGSSEWIYQEMQRRRDILSRTHRPVHRRVFSGSRDIRPLTLVSPSIKRLSAPLSAPSEADTKDMDLAPDDVDWAIPKLTRSRTMPDFGEPIPEEASERSVQMDIRAAKFNAGHHVRKSTQIVADFRDGLWTFFEDLRSATVGEEARPLQPLQAPLREQNRSANATNKKRHSPQARRKTERRSGEPRPHDDARLIDIGGAFWKDQLPGSKTTPSKQSRTKDPNSSRRKQRSTKDAALHTQLYDGDTWETLNSSPGRAPSSSNSSPAQLSHSSRDGNSRNSSQSSVEVMPSPSKAPQSSKTAPAPESEGITWPALSKRASMLRSSAMQLMDEWEKSLNPPETHANENSIKDHVR